MAKPWEAEVHVDEDLAARLVSSAFPDLAPARVELLGSGWDNAAFLVNGAFVFRFPRRAFAVPFFENETRVLAGMPNLPLSIPKPLYHGGMTDAFPWPFSGYRRIDGGTACAADLTDTQREVCAEPLGAFLRALHAIPVATAEELGAGPDTIRRMDVEYRTTHLRNDTVKIRASGVIQPAANWEAIANEAVVASDRRCLVHGDLYLRHLIVEDPGRLIGVIDWGDVHIGHPAIDLSIAHTFLPPHTHDAFRAAYGHISQADWSFARWRALVHTSMLSLFAADVDDRDLIRECDRAFRYMETLE